MQYKLGLDLKPLLISVNKIIINYYWSAEYSKHSDYLKLTTNDNCDWKHITPFRIIRYVGIAVCTLFTCSDKYLCTHHWVFIKKNKMGTVLHCKLSSTCARFHPNYSTSVKQLLVRRNTELWCVWPKLRISHLRPLMLIWKSYIKVNFYGN